MLFSVLVLFIVWLYILQSSADFNCRWETENSTFDLCELQLSTTNDNSPNQKNNTYYQVFDNRASSSYNFTYVFNVCNNIQSRPPDEICWNNTLRSLNSHLMPSGYCATSEINDTNGECIEIEDITINTAGYQIHRGKDTEQKVHDCYRMHNGIDEAIFSYINPDDPATGLRLTYINGDWCEEALRNRQFSLEFYCSEILENIADKKEEIVFEDEICSYILAIYTSYGCPQECPISHTSNRLCDGNGVCEFDYTNTRPRCYCYYGFCGNDCSQTGDECKVSELHNDTILTDDDNCIFTLKDSFGIKAHYNLSYFNLNEENFVVDDALDREYVYKFNICGDLEHFNESVPSSCRKYNHGPCTHYYYDSQLNTKVCDNVYDTFDSRSTAKGVQIFYPKTNKSDAICYWLGMDLPQGFNMRSYDVSLIDPDDAGRGVVFKIMNGEYCEDSISNRELNVVLRCPDTRTFEFDPYYEAKTIINESVYESETCVYDIEFSSPLACPMQCITKGIETEQFAVCSSHGICVSDPEVKRVRCICDNGYIGVVCEKRVDDVTTTQRTNGGQGDDDDTATDRDGWGIGIGVGICVVVVLIIGTYFHSQRKKRLAVNHYNLQGDALIDSGYIK